MSEYDDLDGLDFDPAEDDEQEQVCAAAWRSAEPFARFYRRLKHEGVDHDTSQELTLLYARKIWGIYD